VSDALLPRLIAAGRESGYGKIAFAGGVAANSHIRADIEKAALSGGFELFIPPLRLCGDNGAMIGCQGYYELLAGHTAGQDLNAYATMEL
jgi:N6-L-threonylcarbamoyladenine synthase